MLIFVLGLKRNGNHPIIQWMIANLKKHNLKVGFVNDVNEKSLSFEYIENIINNNKVTVLSYEEISINQFNKIKHKTKFILQEKNFLILRDFPNSFASRKKYISDFKSSTIDIYHYFMKEDEYKKQWMDFANIFLDKEQDQFICLNYNNWFISKKYRDQVFISNFNLNNCDLNFLFVPENAGGSSFDHLLYTGKADKMKVLERWLYYKDDLFFNNFVIEDKSVMNLNNKLFKY